MATSSPEIPGADTEPAETRERAAGRFARNRMALFCAAALLVYAGALAFAAREAASASPFSDRAFWELQLTQPEELDRIRELAVEQGTTALRYTPVGLLAAFVLPLLPGLFGRFFLTTVPAFAAAALISWLVRGAEVGSPWLAPGLLDLVAPLLGSGVGVCLGVTVRRGWRGIAWLVFKSAVAVVLLVGLGATGAFFAVSAEPLPIDEVRVTTDGKRQIVGRLRRNNPLKLRNGGAATLEMPARTRATHAARGTTRIEASTRTMAATCTAK